MSTPPTFSALHRPPHSPLILTNIWSASSAAAVAMNPCTRALATASYAIAATQGLHDDDLTLEANLAAVDLIMPVAREYDLPLTVDLQSGYGERLEEAVRAVVERGAGGCNIEDRPGGSRGELYRVEEAAERVGRVVKEARRAGAEGFVVNARTDAFLVGQGVEEAVQRGKRYLEEGAECVFVWGGPQRGVSREEVERVVAELGGRVSVLLRLKSADPQALTVRELKEIGVARISCGPGLWRASVARVKEEVDRIYEGAEG